MGGCRWYRITEAIVSIVFETQTVHECVKTLRKVPDDRATGPDCCPVLSYLTGRSSALLFWRLLLYTTKAESANVSQSFALLLCFKRGPRHSTFLRITESVCYCRKTRHQWEAQRWRLRGISGFDLWFTNNKSIIGGEVLRNPPSPLYYKWTVRESNSPSVLAKDTRRLGTWPPMNCLQCNDVFVPDRRDIILRCFINVVFLSLY